MRNILTVIALVTGLLADLSAIAVGLHHFGLWPF